MNRRKFVFVLLLSLLVSLFAATSALADHGEPVGSCSPAFELRHVMDHAEHMHRHIGNDKDSNGDGFICMKHLPNDLHLHVDNVLPLN